MYGLHVYILHVYGLPSPWQLYHTPSPEAFVFGTSLSNLYKSLDWAEGYRAVGFPTLDSRGVIKHRTKHVGILGFLQLPVWKWNLAHSAVPKMPPLLRKASLPLNLPNRNEGVFICITKRFSLFLKIGSPSPL